MGKFTVHIIVRVLLIVAISFAIAFTMVNRPTLFIPVILLTVLVMTVANLISYIQSTTRKVSHLLMSLKQNAFTDTAVEKSPDGRQAEFADLIHDVTAEFARVSHEKEIHYQYLKTLNENIGVAILSFDKKENVLMANPAAKQLLQLRKLSILDDLKHIDAALPEKLRSMRTSDKDVLKVVLNKEVVYLSIQVKEIVVDSKPIRIFLLQNIQPELESKEVEAWQQLTRVLTHEIMNSVTPISSLTGAMKNILMNPDGSRRQLADLTAENAEDIHTSLETIGARSQGLLRFVQAYKDFARIPRVNLQPTDINALISNVVHLLMPTLEQSRIQYTLLLPPRHVTVEADEALIGQALINIIKNAIEAVVHDGSGAITITLRQDKKTAIDICDNGPGIEEPDLENIFVPFFTTKSSGTGIGLSLSRQIMKLHRGSITVNTGPAGTCFTLTW